jgi:hypothetical protein
VRSRQPTRPAAIRPRTATRPRTRVLPRDRDLDLDRDLDRDRRANRAVYGFVSRAPADIAGEALTNFLERRILSKRNSRHDHPGRADAALRRALLDKCALQRMITTEPFDRRDVGVLDLRSRDQT